MAKKEAGVALVTGASSGIGRATVQSLVQAGYRVFGTSRKKVDDAPQGVQMLVCDVTDDASVERMLQEVMSLAGRIDLVVNNAGAALIGGAEESSIAQAQALFNVNVFGIFRITNGVLPIMRKQASVHPHGARRQRDRTRPQVGRLRAGARGHEHHLAQRHR